MATIFWNFLMFKQIFLSPQTKRSVIISNKQVASQVAKRLKTYDPRKLGTIGNISKLHRIMD